MSMDMAKREESFPPRGGRRSYVPPELQEWGSIRELTLGGTTFGKNDFPKKGGSLPA